jgi:hypothetical protein
MFWRSEIALEHRYANPLTKDTLEEMKRDGIKKAIAFTQYPQYSCSTTGSSLMEIWRHREMQRSAEGAGIEWSVIDRWGTHPGLVEVSSLWLLSYMGLMRSGQGLRSEHRIRPCAIRRVRTVVSGVIVLRSFPPDECGSERRYVCLRGGRYRVARHGAFG